MSATRVARPPRPAGVLLRLALRRDRITLPAWILVLGLLPVLTALSFAQLYPSPQSRAQLAAGLGHNPAIYAFTGPAFDLTTIGGLTAWRLGGFGAVLAGLMGLFAVTRHTRGEEESGRLELVRSTVVGRHSSLVAALLEVFGAGCALVVLITGGMVASGRPVTGAVALGLGLGSAAWVFGAVAAVTAQLTDNTRAANGMAVAVLGASFLLRAIGDSSGESGPTWLSWISPIGWTQRLRPFAGERWWLLVPILGFAAVLVVVALVLQARRDVAAGVLPPRLGPASGVLSGPFGLAWRLQRGSLAGWTFGFAVVGAALGGIAQGITDVLGTNPQIRAMLDAMGGSRAIVDSFFASMMGLVGMVSAVYGVQAALRLRAEETGRRADPILATPVGRLRWATSHLVFALLGPAVLVAVAGTAGGLAHGLRIGDIVGQLPRVLSAALVQLPAVWVVVGIAAALFGLVPRLVTLSWAALVAFLLLGQLGSLLRLDQWVLDLSPFTHTPQLPGADLTPTPMLWLTAVAAALTALGLAALQRRDLG